MKRQHGCGLFFFCGIIMILLCSGDSTTYLRKGKSMRSLQAAAQRPNIFDGDSTTTNSSSSTTKPLNEPYTEDPFQSNVHQFINTTEIMLQDIATTTSSSSSSSSAVPSITPPTATYISPSQPWYTGPTDPISPSSSSSTTSTSSTTRNNNNNDDDTDYREFMAFIGWYAFLILCCLLPTLCAYYKRRRNEYMVNENIDSIRLRLEEMERDSPTGGVANGFFGSGTTAATTGGASGLDGFQLGERDQDWEVLESLFATTGGVSTSTGSNNVDHDIAAASVAAIFGSVNGGNRQQQVIMSDILGGMSIRMIMAREQRRKRERGLRLVGLLKETSLKVEMSQLIPKEGIVVVGGDDDGGQVGDGTKEEEEGEYGVNLNSNNIEGDVNNNGDIELSSIDNKTDEADVQGGGVNVDNEEATIPGKDPSSIDDDVATNDVEASSSNEVETSPKQETDCVEVDTTTEVPATDQESGVIADPQSSLLQSADETATKENNILSLYQTETDDIFDDDDDDNKYTALCLPCSSSDKDTATSSSTVEATASNPSSLAQSAPPQSTIQDTQPPSSRLVPPTCAICLISYSPGCYVTWSSNPDCIHAFHRDCILMWLLKKEEPLCPCCRREFVSSSRLNTDTSTTASATPYADEYLRRRFVLERSQMLAARSRYVNSILPRPNQTEPPSHWQSLPTGRIRHF